MAKNQDMMGLCALFVSTISRAEWNEFFKVTVKTCARIACDASLDRELRLRASRKLGKLLLGSSHRETTKELGLDDETAERATRLGRMSDAEFEARLAAAWKAAWAAEGAAFEAAFEAGVAEAEAADD